MHASFKETNHSRGQTGASKQTVMRGIALFLDGMSRGVIFSFGPSLVYRLVYGGPLKLGLDCAKVALPLATLASAYLIGRGAGSSLATRYVVTEENQPKIVARLAGTAISLLVFTFGAGLHSVWWLFLIRSLSGVIIGGLCVITKETAPENGSAENYDGSLEKQLEAGLLRRYDNLSPRSPYGNVMPGKAKIYMTAFAVSILAGGLLYRHATGDPTFRALTGSKSGILNLSPLFLIAVSITGEAALRCVFACFKSNEMILRDEDHSRMIERQSLLSEADDILGELPPSPSKAFENEHGFHVSRERLDSTSSSGVESVRGRLVTSDSEFFDCQSVLSGMDEFSEMEEHQFFVDEQSLNSYTSVYVDRKCVDSNGFASFVPTGDSPNKIPANYLKLCQQDSVKAQKMWNKTQEWRKVNEVWRIHCMPNTWFHDIKQAYPHFIHGVSKNGFPVIYEQPGKMNLKELFRGGCNVDDMLRHYMFFLEFISNHICTRDEVRERLGYNAPPHSSSSWGFLVVMDVKGAGLSHLSGDVLTYLKGAGDINNAHYPLTLKRAFLVNSPFWLAGAWKSVKGILPDSVHVDILSSHQYPTALKEFIDEDQIPSEYGGTSPLPLGQHPYEKMLYELIEEAAKEEALYELIEEAAKEDCPAKLNIASSCSESPWRYETPTSTWPHTRRRRLKQTLSSPNGMKDGCEPDDDDRKKKRGHGTVAPIASDILTIVSALFALWTALQGLIEISIPLWLMTPPELGGLGYAPSRSGVAMFCSAMVLLWLLRTKASCILSQISTNAPMRSFRIAVGTQSALLLLLAIIPRTTRPSDRPDAIFVMAFGILSISGIVLASILGRSSSSALHETASVGVTGVAQRQESIIRLHFAAELLGVLLVAPFGTWSLQHGRVAPFDGTCCLLLGSLTAVGLYIGSFSLHLNFEGELVSQTQEDHAEIPRQQHRSFICELIQVSANDMASLIDETNWSLTPLVGRRLDKWDEGVFD